MFESGDIDLGAPVLAFEAAVQIESGTSTKTYTPVSIENPKYSQSNTNNPAEFNPDLEVITQSQVTYKNTSVQVKLTPETVYKTETIIVDAPPTQVLREQKAKTDSKAAMIVLVAVAVLVGFFVLYCARYMFRKQTQEKLDAQRDIKKMQEREKKARGPVMENINDCHTEMKIVQDQDNYEQ